LPGPRNQFRSDFFLDENALDNINFPDNNFFKIKKKQYSLHSKLITFFSDAGDPYWEATKSLPGTWQTTRTIYSLENMGKTN
jgi:hypothetical protein